MSSESQYCANCGERLPKNEWCPIVTERDDDGTLRIRSFCSDDCKDNWRDEADEQ